MMLWFSRKSAVSLLFCAVAASAPAAAQQSASYELSEHVFNAGGHPRDGQVASSANYQVSLDSIGDAFMARGLSSAGYSMDVGFVPTYPPPGEVLGLRFPADDSTLAWDAEPSVGNYDLYRDLLSTLSGLGFGQCFQQDIVGTTASDADLPARGNGFFYLVTAENRIGEKGTKGNRSNGVERTGTVCP